MRECALVDVDPGSRFRKKGSRRVHRIVTSPSLNDVRTIHWEISIEVKNNFDGKEKRRTKRKGTMESLRGLLECAENIVDPLLLLQLYMAISIARIRLSIGVGYKDSSISHMIQRRIFFLTHRSFSLLK